MLPWTGAVDPHPNLGPSVGGARRNMCYVKFEGAQGADHARQRLLGQGTGSWRLGGVTRGHRLAATPYRRGPTNSLVDTPSSEHAKCVSPPRRAPRKPVACGANDLLSATTSGARSGRDHSASSFAVRWAVFQLRSFIGGGSGGLFGSMVLTFRGMLGRKMGRPKNWLEPASNDVAGRPTASIIKTVLRQTPLPPSPLRDPVSSTPQIGSLMPIKPGKRRGIRRRRYGRSGAPEGAAFTLGRFPSAELLQFSGMATGATGNESGQAQADELARANCQAVQKKGGGRDPATQTAQAGVKGTGGHCPI